MAQSAKFTHSSLLKASGIFFALFIVCATFSSQRSVRQDAPTTPQPTPPQPVSRMSPQASRLPKVTATAPTATVTPRPAPSTNPTPQLARATPTPREAQGQLPDQPQSLLPQGASLDEDPSPRPGGTMPRMAGRAVHPLNASQCEQRIDSYERDPGFFTIPPECLNQFRARQRSGRP